MSAISLKAPGETTPLLPLAPLREQGPASTLRFSALCGAVFLLLFCGSSQTSMLTTTQSKIAQEYSAYDNAVWLISSYAIPAGCTTPLAGRLVSMFSLKRVLVTASFTMALGSLLSGLAPRVGTFFAGRALCGISAGFIGPAISILILDLAPVHRRGLYVGLQNSSYTVGTALGGTLGGYIATRWSWHEVFWLQAPLLLLSTSVLTATLPAAATHISKRRLLDVDYLGVLSLSASLCFLLFSLTGGFFVLWAFLTSVLCLLLFIGIELRVAREPIIPITLLRHPPLLFSCFSALLISTARWFILFYGPIYTIAVLHWSPAAAGASLIPSSLGYAAGGLGVGYLGMRRGGSFYGQTLASILIFGTTFVAFHRCTHHTPLSLYAALLFLNGAGAGAVLNYGFGHLIHTLDDSSGQAIATSLLATFRSFSGSIGSALGGVLMARALEATFKRLLEHGGPLTPEEDRLVRQLKGTPSLPWELQGIERQAAILSYRDAINLVILAGGVLTGLALIIQAGARPKPPRRVDIFEPAIKQTGA